MNMGGEESGGSAGPVIGVIVILAIVVLGGLYFWGQRSNDALLDDAAVDEVVESIGEQSEADDTSSIEADLDATDVENVDAEINAS